MRSYNESIDKLIIELLYHSNELTFGQLEEQLKPNLEHFSYKTYSKRLNAMSKPKKDKDSRYAIQPVLIKRDLGRGSNVFYSLTKNARTRCDLKLPIMKSDSLVEKAYRILLRSIAFEHSPYRILKDENEYNSFLQKFLINKNELQLDGDDNDVNKNPYRVTKLIHQQSGIKINYLKHLEESDNYGDFEYYYKLPGISIRDFVANYNPGLPYGHLSFKEDQVNEYFKLLENKGLIEKAKYFTSLTPDEEERYNIVDKKDNRFKKFLKECWLLQGSTAIYPIPKWRGINKPTEEEKIWYEELWGKQRTKQMLTSYSTYRITFKKNKNKQVEKEIQTQLISHKLALKNKFEKIQNEYPDIINAYSYLVDPLLNLVYPQFLRD